LIVEENDVPTTVFVEIPGIEAPIRGITDPNLQIALDVDLSLGAETIAARVRYIDDGVFTNWVSTSAVSLPADVKSAILGNYNNAGALTGAVVGLVASAPSGDDSFAASWDWVEVTGQEAVETVGTVLYRWNAGKSDVAAVDGGMDWIADASVVTGGPSNVYTGNITNLHSSASQYTFPTGIFTQERWDPASGSEMSLEFGEGGLASGTYVGIGNGGMFEWLGQVTDGTINIDFDRVLQNPQINGVEIVQISTSGIPTDSVNGTSVGDFSDDGLNPTTVNLALAIMTM